MQHIYRNLKPGGRAAVVLPDNVLFEAGVGTDVRRDLMHKCNLHTILRLPTGIFYAQGVKTNVLFFTKGSAANKHQEQNCTANVWVYDLRTNMPSFGKRTPFDEQHLAPFEAVFSPLSLDGRGAGGEGEAANTAHPENRKEGEYSFHSEDIKLPEETKATEENQGVNERMLHSRWRCFSRHWISDTKGDSLDISWLKDSDSVDAANLPEPSVLAGEAMSELVQALGELDGLMRELGAGDEADGQRASISAVMGLDTMERT